MRRVSSRIHTERMTKHLIIYQFSSYPRFNQHGHIYLQLLSVVPTLQLYGQQCPIHSHMLPTKFLREVHV